MRLTVPDGHVLQTYRFALDPTPRQERAMLAHADAARFTNNHMLARVKAVIDQRAAERSYGIAGDDLTPIQGWSTRSLQKTWNSIKDQVAPWWPQHSKEAYNTGLDALAAALDGWTKSRRGDRQGAHVGFPRYKKKGVAKVSVRFTTGLKEGPARVDADRHHLTLPRVGTVRTHESTRKLGRGIERGSARVIFATLTRERAGRWHVCLNALVQRPTSRPSHIASSPRPVVGVDVGVRDLFVVATPSGHQVARIPAPRTLTAAQPKLRALTRRASRQRGPYEPKTGTRQQSSKRYLRTRRRIARLHRRVANQRRDTLHKATTILAQQHQVVVLEKLNVAGMRSFGGAYKRGLNRVVDDAAFGSVRRMLTYKTRWYGSILVDADPWYPSTKTCSFCGGRKPRMSLKERIFTCEQCGVVVDRDLNAAINLARFGETHALGETSPAGGGPVAGRGADCETEPAAAGDAGGCEASTSHGVPAGQTRTATPQGEAAQMRCVPTPRVRVSEDPRAVEAAKDSSLLGSPPASNCQASRATRERGSEGIQFAAIALPLLLIVFGILQATLYFVTDLQASSAAQVGAQAARGETASADAGIAAAQANIARIDIAKNVAVTGTRTANDVVITVTANAPTLIPFLALPPVVATAHGVVEHPTR